MCICQINDNLSRLSLVCYYTIGELTIGKKQEMESQKKLTQDALAKKADLPYTTLAKIESDVITKPSIQTVEKILKGLEVKIDELIR